MDSSLVQIDSILDCGPFEFLWKQKKDGEVLGVDLDTTVFYVNLDMKRLETWTADPWKAGSYLLSYQVSLTNYPAVASVRIVDFLTITVYDPCSAAAGLSIPYPTLGATQTYYYTGAVLTHDVSSFFSTSDPQCSIVNFTCHRVVGGLLGGDCSYQDGSTSLYFYTTTGVLAFSSTDEHSPEFPALSTYQFYIEAYAGTKLDVAAGGYLSMWTHCMMEVDEFVWLVPTYEEISIISKHYIPSWTFPQSMMFLHPLDPNIVPQVYDDQHGDCMDAVTPITFRLASESYD